MERLFSFRVVPEFLRDFGDGLWDQFRIELALVQTAALGYAKVLQVIAVQPTPAVGAQASDGEKGLKDGDERLRRRRHSILFQIFGRDLDVLAEEDPLGTRQRLRALPLSPDRDQRSRWILLKVSDLQPEV